MYIYEYINLDGHFSSFKTPREPRGIEMGPRTGLKGRPSVVRDVMINLPATRPSDEM